MSQKSIHVVFQMLNFLHSDLAKSYNLIPIDRLILINLASHNGKKGICPSTTTIAKELNITSKHVKERLSYLESINLISIRRTNGKRSQYKLYIPFSTG